MEWEVVIGLETHTQLKTKSKIFSGSSIAFGAEPNTQASAVDIALPGVLPVLNKEAVKCAIKFGLAVNAEIAPRSVFNRKNYFYPDLPKGYQISQFELPVVGKGSLTIQVGDTEKTIRITRAHLEEDAGKSLHGDFEGMTGIDLNRAGTPLLEIVTEPDMRSAAEAVAYAKNLHELVQWIDICDGNMQEGSFRCDVNVSVRRKGSDKLGTRREIKNLNSFKFMQQAIEYETRWQIETLEDGGSIQQATVLFNPDTGETRSMRSKEEANDYRYFPDPDLLPLDITEEYKAEVMAEFLHVGTPNIRKNEYIHGYELSSYDASQLTQSRGISIYFDEVIKVAGKENAKIAANWIVGTLAAKLNDSGLDISKSQISPQQLAGLLQRIRDGVLSSNSAKIVFEEMWTSLSAHVSIKSTVQAALTDIDEIIERGGLKQVSDLGAIEAIIDEVLAVNAAMVEEFKAGKEKAFNALVGQAMKASKGKANPAQVNEILKKKLTS